MSKTDNTRPYLLRANDLSVPGTVNHHCGCYAECDYVAGSRVRSVRDADMPNCYRSVLYGPADSGARNARRFWKDINTRGSRRNARHQLQMMLDVDDFDLLPCRSDQK